MMCGMTRTLIPEARATLALAAARGMTEGQAATAMGITPSTLSRKKTAPDRWNRGDNLSALRVFGDGIDELIADLQALRATRQYHAPTGLDRDAVGQAS